MLQSCKLSLSPSCLPFCFLATSCSSPPPPFLHSPSSTPPPPLPPPSTCFALPFLHPQLAHGLGSGLAHWAACEWFYSSLERPWFAATHPVDCLRSILEQQRQQKQPQQEVQGPPNSQHQDQQKERQQQEVQQQEVQQQQVEQQQQQQQQEEKQVQQQAQQQEVQYDHREPQRQLQQCEDARREQQVEAEAELEEGTVTGPAAAPEEFDAREPARMDERSPSKKRESEGERGGEEDLVEALFPLTTKPRLTRAEWTLLRR